ncbi:MAG: hypothetical protein JJ971_03500 [Balneolaceae bacterium]|nr:hypothetical protein [Balneolaceae bacterium]MBO6545437.1 hypothetical protein [Balneolaceae bacterium]MBO6646833.1 hypothetical protein [Balneolaceae bacterium]
MTKSLQQLLTSCINYSGLYPPAGLNLREALRGYVDFSHSKYSWMLSNFVIPHSELPLLATFADRKHQLKGPLALCITGPESETLFDFKNAVINIEKEIMAAHSGYPGEVRTNILELTFPLGSVQKLNAEELVKSLEAVVNSTAESRLLPHRVFFGVPGNSYDAETTKKIIKVIAVHNKSILKRKIDNYLFSGLKVDCGGITPPSAKYLADVLLYARDASVAVKFSGTENTPFPSFNYTTQHSVHGFLNLLIASMLAYTQDLNLEETMEVIEDKNPDNFGFKDGYLLWRELAAPIMELKMLRMLSITSFNFTTFSNPIEGLKERNLI